MFRTYPRCNVSVKTSLRTVLIANTVLQPDREKRYENKGGGFVTGVDIFGEEEQNKLGLRAKRFGLDPSKLKPLTEQELDKLYER